MKRLISIAVLGTAALLLPSSLIAQRGMSGHGSGGGSRGSSGSVSRGSSGIHSAGPSGFRSSGGFRPSGGVRSTGGFRSNGAGVRSFAPARRSAGFTSFGPAGRSFASRSFASNRGFFNSFGFRRFGNRPFFGGCFGCFSPFFFGGGFFGGGLFLGSPFYPYYPYYPGYPYYSGDYYGASAQQPVVNTDSGSTVQLAAEVQHLSDEVDNLSNSRRYEDRPSLSSKESAVATVFVFRDGRRMSAQSYAISGPTLWIFNENTARKFQITDLDASATEQVNAANGVEFHVPGLQGTH
jgi:hypothetical protein